MATVEYKQTLRLEWSRHLTPEEWEAWKDLCYKRKISMNLALCQIIKKEIKKS